MRTKVIVNPVSGRGRTGKVWAHIARHMEELGISADYVFTEGHKHAVSLASRAVEDGYERVVAVGGDGTNLEVIDGIAGSDVLMGIIPSGTGNDLARSLGIPLDPFKACELLHGAGVGDNDISRGEAAGRCIRRIDIGRIRDHSSGEGWTHFANIAGIGFDAKIARDVNAGVKWLSGTWAYLFSVVRNLAGYSPNDMEFTIDGEHFARRAALIAVGNGRYYGGGMKITPGAMMDDGLFDICIVGDVNRFELITQLLRVFSGEHVTHPKVEMIRGRRIEIRSQKEVWYHADGEVIGMLPLEFEIVPNCISVIGGSD